MKSFWNNVVEFWQDSVNFLLGVWLVLSAWILQFADIQVAMWNALVFGIIIAVAAFAALVRFSEWEEWIDMLIGIWLIISPWVLGFASFGTNLAGGSAVATWNVVLVGIVTLAMAMWSLRDHRHHEPHAG